jgi:hypothetical protein
MMGANACRYEAPMKESLAGDILNSLAENVAVVDSSGVIVAVNEAWTLFGQENGGGASSGHVSMSWRGRIALVRSARDAAGAGGAPAGGRRAP